jgi:hypothetical protein
VWLRLVVSVDPLEKSSLSSLYLYLTASVTALQDQLGVRVGVCAVKTGAEGGVVSAGACVLVEGDVVPGSTKMDFTDFVFSSTGL